MNDFLVLFTAQMLVQVSNYDSGDCPTIIKVCEFNRQMQVLGPKRCPRKYADA